MFKFNRTNRNAITTIVVILAIILVLSATKSAYSPRPITIKAKTEKSIFGLDNKLECAPGQGKKGSAYTKGLTPGGLCGAQKLVDDYASYDIEDGIGGSLI
jgi:hypothetical protein|tara:strand:+ start:157 stop:459 length:303 start_codon:yes stop_codon:yes gene_type:complete